MLRSRQRQSKANKDGTCRLCHVSSKLQESHIFPRSLIKLVRDKSMNHRFYELRDKASNVIQDGPKEYLLCEGCEQRLSRYEKYFKEAIHLSRHGIQVVQDGSYATIRNLDYSRVKLFLLSVVWRMGISSVHEFRGVSLGEHKDVIRRMIITEDPGRTDKYPIGAIIPLINGRMQEGWLSSPFEIKHGGGTIYCPIIGGILYLVCIGQSSTLCNSQHLLNKSGTWVMPLIEFDRIPFLDAFLRHQFNEEDSVEGQV